MQRYSTPHPLIWICCACALYTDSYTHPSDPLSQLTLGLTMEATLTVFCAVVLALAPSSCHGQDPEVNMDAVRPLMFVIIGEMARHYFVSVKFSLAGLPRALEHEKPAGLVSEREKFRVIDDLSPYCNVFIGRQNSVP